MVIFVIAALILGPVILIYFLKSSPTMVFLSVCMGGILQIFVVKDLGDLAVKANSSLVSTDNLNIAVLVLPVILTLLLTANAVHRSKFFIHIMPAICSGALLALLLIPALPFSVRSTFLSSTEWSSLQKYQAIIVGIGALTSLILGWLTTPKHGKESKHKN